MSLQLEERDLSLEEIQCTLRKQLKPYGLDGGTLFQSYVPHQQRLIELVKRTSFMGESNSVLVIGPRGSGKSALLSSVMTELRADSCMRENLIQIILNGLLHTDDNIALKEIMRQLNVENMGEKITGSSFAEKLTVLLEALKYGTKQNKSILFVLDEFDLFCSHKDQTLLYNLFDVAQSQQSPICIIGLTCSPNILNKLENRVKSRFSYQMVCLFDHMNFTNYMELTSVLLSLPNEFSNSKCRKQWNSSLNDVLEQNTVKEVLKKYFTFASSIRDLKRFLAYTIMYLSPSHPKLVAGDFLNAFGYCFKDVKSSLLQGLSILEVSLVITMMHLTEIYDGEPFNFEMVYHEYKKFLQKKMSLQNLDKAVVMKALEHLLAIELVKPVNDPSSNLLKRFMSMRLLLDPDQIREALKRYPNLPYQLQQWSSSGLLE